MPVRIIFRGLILFKVENEGTEAGTITAKLIDAPDEFHSEMHEMGEASGLHSHAGEMQIYSSATQISPDNLETSDATHGERPMDAEADRTSSIPFEYVSLKAGENINLTIGGDQFVKRDETYEELCPSLPSIAKTAHLERHQDKNLKARFVRNTVTINRGTIRVRDVVSWDSGAPELGEHRRTGINVPVPVRFVGGVKTGYVASECVIDVLGPVGVTIGSDLSNTSRELRPTTAASLHAPPKMVEILITNFAPQRTRPLPWSLHYRWMFEAAGYRARPLPKDDLDAFEAAVKGYEKDTLDGERKMFLKSENGQTIGLPFPYIDLNNPLVSKETPGWVAALTTADPWDRPLCPLGDEGTTGGG